MHQNILRTIPSVNEILEFPEITKLVNLYPRQFVVDAIREVLEGIRQSLTDKTVLKEDIKASSQPFDFSPQKLHDLIQHVLQQSYVVSSTRLMQRALSFTLDSAGRLAEEAAKQIQNVLHSFCTLEIEKYSGKRGFRYHNIEQLICMITGAESALVVNNNAAAVLLALDTLARGKEVVISRSHLVEIGGNFACPTS